MKGGSSSSFFPFLIILGDILSGPRVLIVCLHFVDCHKVVLIVYCIISKRGRFGVSPVFLDVCKNNHDEVFTVVLRVNMQRM